jgi:hypothetical protein
VDILLSISGRGAPPSTASRHVGAARSIRLEFGALVDVGETHELGGVNAALQ